MSSESPENLIDRHEAFLKCRAVDRPLIGHWVGGYYPAEQFPRGTARWRNVVTLRPEDVSLAAFVEDYEQLYQAHRECEDDFFYVGSAYWGIPWLEAVLGCPVTMAAGNCRAEPCLKDIQDADHFDVGIEASPWWQALLRFTLELVEFSRGRFPVCPPLLRGPGDAASAMLGGMAFVIGLVDEPQRIRTLLEHCARVRLTVLEHLQAAIPSWRGTHAAGGYPSKVWCRQTVAYYQEDSAALLNPRLFREFLLPLARGMCQAAEINFIHLHSACLYPVDILLEEATFDVLEINFDHKGAGPEIAVLIPTLKRIQLAGYPLVLWGQCAPDDWELIRRELSPVGLSLQPMFTDSQTTGS